MRGDGGVSALAVYYSIISSLFQINTMIGIFCFVLPRMCSICDMRTACCHLAGAQAFGHMDTIEPLTSQSIQVTQLAYDCVLFAV